MPETPGSDAARPGSDAARPGSDAARPGSDAARPGSDAARPAPTAARLEKLKRCVAHRMGGIVLVLEALEDAGNRAAILRSTEALGIFRVHEIARRGEAAVAGRGTAAGRAIVNGAEKWLQIQQHDTAADCVRQLRQEQYLVYAAVPPALPSHTGAGEAGAGEASSSEGAERESGGAEGAALGPRRQLDLTELDPRARVALVFGNERLGVSEALQELAHGSFSIPMCGLTESLNVSVAVAVALHWVRQQRQLALGAPSDLTPLEAANLLQAYSSAAPQFTRSKKKSLRTSEAFNATHDAAPVPEPAHTPPPPGWVFSNSLSAAQRSEIAALIAAEGSSGATDTSGEVPQERAGAPLVQNGGETGWVFSETLSPEQRSEIAALIAAEGSSGATESSGEVLCGQPGAIAGDGGQTGWVFSKNMSAEKRSEIAALIAAHGLVPPDSSR